MDQNTKERGQNSGRSEQIDLSLLLDVPLQVTVELGRTQMTIDSLLKLSQGSVIELNRPAGEPLDIYLNNKLMARGEAVVAYLNLRYGTEEGRPCSYRAWSEKPR
jgi:flagellar motor switch protein FliN/FliY